MYGERKTVLPFPNCLDFFDNCGHGDHEGNVREYVISDRSGVDYYLNFCGTCGCYETGIAYWSVSETDPDYADASWHETNDELGDDDPVDDRDGRAHSETCDGC